MTDATASTDPTPAINATPAAAPAEGTLISQPPAATKPTAPAASTEALEKPEWLEAKFWTDKGPNVEALAKSYDVAQRALGRKAQAVVPPNEKSTPEEIAEYRKAIGVPESPEEYNLKPEQLPEGVVWDEATAKKAAELAHKHNVPAAAMQEFMQFDMERAALMNQAAASMIEQQLQAGRQELQKVWGDKMPEKIDLARRAALTVGVDPSSQGFVDPAVVKAIVSLAEKLSDDKLVAGDQTSVSSTNARARDIMTNPANPLYNRYREGDAEVVDQVRRMLTQSI